MDQYMLFKKRIYEIIEASKTNDPVSKSYDFLILTATVVGLIPLTLKTDNYYTRIIDLVTVSIFLVDYILRLYTSDYKMGIRSIYAYLAYAIMPIAIVDMLSVLPILAVIFPGSKTIALFRIFRIFQLFKVLRYSSAMVIIGSVLRKVWRPLFAVFTLASLYIFACALIMFQLEPDIFTTFFDAIYWSGCTVLTVGYGDISPLTQVGRVITVVSAMVGMAVIALPSGIITAGYMDELKKSKKNPLIR